MINNLLSPVISYVEELELKHSASSSYLESALKMNDDLADELISVNKFIPILISGVKYMLQNVPYKFGGTWEKDKVFDCSSFVQKIFAENGIALPRVSRDQAKSGVAVNGTKYSPGDLLFFDTNNDGIINHVGMYISDDLMIHTAKVGENINLSNFKTRYKKLVAVRRVI